MDSRGEQCGKMSRHMKTIRWVSCALVWFGYIGPVAAGPKEVFAAIGVASGSADNIGLRFINGDGGMFVSRDGGASFRLTCFGAVDSRLLGKSVYAFTVATDGSMCAGTGESLYCSDAQACSWKKASEVDGKWIGDFAEDPLDKNVLYLVTGTSDEENGVYVRENPSAMWKPLGKQLSTWFSRLHVVKKGSDKRFWTSAVENVMVDRPGGGQATEVRYSLRYSDDNAATWTSHYWGPITDRAQLRLVAVDPNNPDRVVVMLQRTTEMAPDDLYYSDKRGEPDSFVKIGSVMELAGTVFLPDGSLVYGDNDQTTPGLFKVVKLGDPPVKLSEAYKVSCLTYDAATDRLYVCADWRFGTIDRANGEMTTLFDIRKAELLLECAGEPDMKEQCAVALNSPNFCDITHYPESPLCMKHFGTTGFADSSAGGGADAAAGVAGMGAGMAGAGSAAAGSGGTGQAATSSPAGTPGKAGAGGKPAPRNNGCSSSGRLEPQGGWSATTLLFIGTWLVLVCGSARSRRTPV